MVHALLGDLGTLGSENTKDNTFPVSKHKVACVFSTQPSTYSTNKDNVNPHLRP